MKVEKNSILIISTEKILPNKVAKYKSQVRATNDSQKYKVIKFLHFY